MKTRNCCLFRKHINIKSRRTPILKKKSNLRLAVLIVVYSSHIKPINSMLLFLFSFLFPVTKLELVWSNEDWVKNNNNSYSSWLVLLLSNLFYGQRPKISLFRPGKEQDTFNQSIMCETVCILMTEPYSFRVYLLLESISFSDSKDTLIIIMEEISRIWVLWAFVCDCLLPLLYILIFVCLLFDGMTVI